jgi:hypothetical protein
MFRVGAATQLEIFAHRDMWNNTGSACARINGRSGAVHWCEYVRACSGAGGNRDLRIDGAVGGGTPLLMAAAASLIQALRIARLNPADTLREE